MVTKQNSIELTIRGVMSNAYWGLRLHAGQNVIERRLDTTTAVFPIKNRADGWKYWRHGGDLYGEKAVINDALEHVEPTDTFWDVGSADGGYSAFLGQHCANTVAFEPDPGRVDRLRETLKLNGIDAVVRQHTLGRHDGTVDLNDDQSIRYIDESQGGTNEQEVHRGDSVSSDPLPSPDIMKVDTEGAELDVLRGMGDLLSEIRVLYFEPHPDKYKKFGTNWAEVEKFLTSLSFDLEPISADRLNPLYRATRKE